MTAPVIDDEKWEAIARKLPENASARLFRHELELYAQTYRERSDPAAYEAQRKASKRTCKLIKQAAETLIEHYTLGMAWRRDCDLMETSKRHEEFVCHLHTAIDDAERNLRDLAKPRGRRDKEQRDAFLNAAINLWQKHGGKVTTTTDPSTGQAIGLLESYLVAVASAVGHQVTTTAMREVVRERVKRGVVKG